MYKSIFIKGFTVGSIGLITFYFIFLYVITGDIVHPINQFKLFQPWMSILIIGFGIQFGLYQLLKKNKEAALVTGTGTATSSVAMVACCAHHVVDLLPILGFSAAAIFLSDYQKQFLIFGVITNLVGILMMLWFLRSKTK